MKSRHTVNNCNDVPGPNYYNVDKINSNLYKGFSLSSRYKNT